ncbi:uncharacterized protein JCM6883_006737 [Sporobolomyces salmoneus]|uniref:uncharacterized protein n=1 Tax=Sporobolomyces salmoneus TaxID=183962 RepID=UPI00316B4CCF
MSDREERPKSTSKWIDTLFREKENSRDESKGSGEGEDGTMDKYDEADDDYYPEGGSFGGWGVGSLEKLDPYDWGPTDILDPISYLQLEALDTYPHLRPLVQGIDFNGRSEGKPTSLAIQRILKLCGNVRSIVIHRGAVRKLGEVAVRLIQPIVEFAPNLESLSLFDLDGENGAGYLYKRLPQLKHLKHLSLSFAEPEDGPPHDFDVDETEDPTDDEEDLKLNLSKLSTPLSSLTLGNVATSDFYASIPDSFHSSITSLGVTVRREIPDLSSFRNLEHLTIKFALPKDVAETLSKLSSSASSSPAPLPNLTSVELRYSSDLNGIEMQQQHFERKEKMRNRQYGESDDESSDGFDEEEDGGSIVDIFRKLPSTVTTLSMPYVFWPEDRKQFKQAILVKTLQTSLKTIALYFADGDDEEGWDEKESKKIGRELEQWANSTANALEKKGVNVIRIKGEELPEKRDAIHRMTNGLHEKRKETKKGRGRPRKVK